MQTTKPLNPLLNQHLSVLVLATAIGLTTVFAKPLDREAIDPLQLSTFKGYHYDYSLGNNGVYKFSYSLPKSSRSEQRSESGEVKGAYSFVAPEGDEFDFKYEAGKKGFQVESDALPEAPIDTDEVRQAKQVFFEAYKKALELVSSSENSGGYYGTRRGDDDDDEEDESSEEDDDDSSEEDDDESSEEDDDDESSEEDDDDESSEESSEEDDDDESSEESSEEDDDDEESDEDDDEDEEDEDEEDEDEEDEEDEDEEDEEEEENSSDKIIKIVRPVSRRRKTYSRNYFTPAPFRNYGNKNIIKATITPTVAPTKAPLKIPYQKPVTKPTRKRGSYKSSRSKTTTTKRPYSKSKLRSPSAKRAKSVFKRPVFLSSLPTKRPTTRQRSSTARATPKTPTRNSYYYVK